MALSTKLRALLVGLPLRREAATRLDLIVVDTRSALPDAGPVPHLAWVPEPSFVTMVSDLHQ